MVTPLCLPVPITHTARSIGCCRGRGPCAAPEGEGEGATSQCGSAVPLSCTPPGLSADIVAAAAAFASTAAATCTGDMLYGGRAPPDPGTQDHQRRCP